MRGDASRFRRIAYKAERRVEISAAVTEAVAKAFENYEALHGEGSPLAGVVTVSDIAGARFVAGDDGVRLGECIPT